jgi:hypothetical protein
VVDLPAYARCSGLEDLRGIHGEESQRTQPTDIESEWYGSSAVELTYPDLFARETRRVGDLAMRAVMATERRLGYEPHDVGRDDLGYDIESRAPARCGSETRPLRFIEVKGRIADARTVTVTKNEILTALNKPEDWILALVEVPPVGKGVPPFDAAFASNGGVPPSPDFAAGDAFRVSEDPAPYGMPDGCVVRYVRRPFHREPDFGVTSVNYDLPELMARAEEPT